MQQLKYTEPTQEASDVPEAATKTEIFVMLPMVRFAAINVSNMQMKLGGSINDACASLMVGFAVVSTYIYNAAFKINNGSISCRT